METQLLALTPYENFLFGMKAKETRRQYPHRLDKFLTFMGLQGTIEEKCTLSDNLKTYEKSTIDYLTVEIERMKKKWKNLKKPNVVKYNYT